MTVKLTALPYENQDDATYSHYAPGLFEELRRGRSLYFVEGGQRGPIVNLPTSGDVERESRMSIVGD